MIRRLALGICLALGSCGGGGGSPTPGGVSSAPPPARPVDFGFWYTLPGQLDQTTGPGKPVNIVFCQADSPDIPYDESLLIQCAQEAQAHGIHRWIASVGPFLFTPQFAYKGAAQLGPLCQQFHQLDIMPAALYLLDEPDLHLGASAATIIPQAAADARAACPGPKIAAIYAHTTPGYQALDWWWLDDGTNPDALTKQPPLLQGQQYLPIVYGSDPYRQDPSATVAFAAAHAVAAVLAFAWATFGNMAGISVNGEAPAYLRDGCQLTGLC